MPSVVEADQATQATESIFTPKNTLFGTILPLAYAQAISEYVRALHVPKGQKPVAMHLDAARLFDGVIGEGVDLKAFAACFDSMSICLVKDVGAPMGSIILGKKSFIERAYIPRFPSVHKMARSVASEIEALGYNFSPPVQTNMIILDLEVVGIPPSAFAEYCAREKVAVFAMARIVFHHQTSEAAVKSLVTAPSKLIEDKKNGVALEDKKVGGGYS
ncbi:hypothetical protein BHE90_004569 [Fusarium euwallaceae]|uniref:Aromatic amino acid beta-eliminating lyase/threonine aldolase domain-containing protein n=1 Tax=Fusarium euwallaceae TaxID=1147111 RepID=A0A430LYX1_9HYPO|nr:hypothetical protein BHE90_004569 [Fusarium euwallaceae]